MGQEKAISKQNGYGLDELGMKCLRPLEHWDRGFESR
jgi:hypothetical protein